MISFFNRMSVSRRTVMTVVFFVASILTTADNASPNDALQSAPKLVNVEGKALLRADMHAMRDWKAGSRVLLDYGKYVGFIREDGSFVIEGVPPGSYIVEVTNADYIFESVRIDISSKGKIRARRLNLLQPNAVTTLPYPVQLYARQPAKYFRVREEWRVTDVLMNPMVIMLLVAFFILIVTPKLANQDPQMQKEMQNVQLPKVDMADTLASFFEKFFSGGNSNKRAIGGASSSSTSSSGGGGGSSKRPAGRRTRQ